MFKTLTPSQVLASGFLGLILVGTLLLAIPFSSADGHSIGLVDALFTSVSSVCVTGLIVKNTPHAFSFFGQTIIILLVQIGGLGYMTSATILSILLGKKIGLSDRLRMKESFNVLTMEGLVRFTKGVLWVTLLIEGVAAALLTMRFAYDYPFSKALHLGIFHAISAFNNAGFSLFADNMVGYRGDVAVNIIVLTLIILGGIGFFIISDLYRYLKKEIHTLSLHTKLTLVVSVVLIFISVLLLFLFESHNGATLQGLSLKDRILAALFQSVSARTAGFNTIATGNLTNGSLFMLIILMVIGGSPGSTAGGIKTTTVAVMIVSLWATVRGRLDTTVFGRRLPVDLIAKAFLLTTMATIIIITSTTTLLLTENKSLIRTLFEVASAFGTVGYSTGDGGVLSLSALFSNPGKIFIAITMYVGRLGPLLLSIAVVKGASFQGYRYPEEKVIIG